MITDIQKASLLKRISAAILDIIITLVISVGFMYVTNVIVGYDNHANFIEDKQKEYEENYGVTFNLTEEEYNALTDQEKEYYQEIQNIINNDSEFIKEYNLLIGLTQAIASIGIFFGVLFTEFILPLIFKNGQTLGKRLFNLSVVKTNGVRINNIQLFVRGILGKYTIEIMLPICVLILIYFNVFGSIVMFALIGFFILEIALYLFTKLKTPIHDLLAYTVVVDGATQMIFNSEEELLKYKEQNHFDYVNKLKY